MPVKFCNGFCHKCTCYFLVTSQSSKLACTRCLILHELGISSLYEDGFSKVKNAYIEGAYYIMCDDYGVDANETWMHDDWFYRTDYAIFGHEVKATERSPPDNLTRWIITQLKGFRKKDIEQISRSVRAYVYLVLTCQAQAKSSIVGNSAPAVILKNL